MYTSLIQQSLLGKTGGDRTARTIGTGDTRCETIQKQDQDTKNGNKNQQNEAKKKPLEDEQKTENTIANFNAHTQTTIITKASIVQ